VGRQARWQEQKLKQNGMSASQRRNQLAAGVELTVPLMLSKLASTPSIKYEHPMSSPISLKL